MCFMMKKSEELKNNGAIKIVKISALAIAALDILGAEKYTGTDELIKELINEVFFKREIMGMYPKIRFSTRF